MSSDTQIVLTRGGSSSFAAVHTPQATNAVVVAERSGPPAIVAFTDATRQGFIEYLRNLGTDKKLIMDVEKRARYRNYHANPKAKPNSDFDLAQKQRFFSERFEALNKYDINSDGQLVRLPQKEGNDPKLVAFDYDAFKYIEDAHREGLHNGIKKTHQRVIAKVWGITRKDVQWVLAHCKVQNRQTHKLRTVCDP
jgi:hypothetical protein